MGDRPRPTGGMVPLVGATHASPNAALARRAEPRLPNRPAILPSAVTRENLRSRLPGESRAGSVTWPLSCPRETALDGDSRKGRPARISVPASPFIKSACLVDLLCHPRHPVAGVFRSCATPAQGAALAWGAPTLPRAAWPTASEAVPPRSAMPLCPQDQSMPAQWGRPRAGRYAGERHHTRPRVLAPLLVPLPGS